MLKPVKMKSIISNDLRNILLTVIDDLEERSNVQENDRFIIRHMI